MQTSAKSYFIDSPNNFVDPKLKKLSTTLGNIFLDIPKILNISSDHSSFLGLKIIVLEALVISVRWELPSVKFHNNQVSIVPNKRLSFLRLFFAIETLSKIHFIFVAEK